MSALIEVTRSGTLLGYVQAVMVDGTVRWRSWRPEDQNPGKYLPGPIGIHQDQAQAERYLLQLAPPAIDLPPARGSRGGDRASRVWVGAVAAPFAMPGRS